MAKHNDYIFLQDTFYYHSMIPAPEYFKPPVLKCRD